MNSTTIAPTSGLITDEYSLVMPQFLYLQGKEPELNFELYVRRLPADWGFIVAAGLEQALQDLAGIRFTSEEIETLASIPEDPADPDGRRLFRDSYLRHLKTVRFRGTVHAVAEGTVVAAQTPLLQITATPTEAMMVEGRLLANIGYPTAVATRAARMAIAADGLPIADNILRRGPGADIGALAARAAYLGGLTSTSNLLARHRYGVPSYGTMAHCLVQMHGEDGEERFFEDWLRTFPGRTGLLPDAFDTPRGVERAIAASLTTGVALKGLRQDSGDAETEVNHMTDRLSDAGLSGAKVIASDSNDEYTIEHLRRTTDVASFAVGNAAANPTPLGPVYKIVAQQHNDPHLQALIKLAVGKATDPGTHQVHRTRHGDVLSLTDELVGGVPLMERVMVGGALTHDLPTLTQSRERCLHQIAALTPEQRQLRDPEPLRLLRTEKLIALRERLGDETARDLPAYDPQGVLS